MSLDDILNTVEKVLPPSRFGAIERFILRQSWLGQTYSQMAQESGYGSEYIKEVGSRLWQDLSDAIGERVTKKNLQLIFNQSQFQQSQFQQSQFQQSQEHPSELLNPQNHPAQQSPLARENPIPDHRETRIGFPGGPIPLNSPFYIERPPIEDLVCAEIKQPGSVIRIKAPRQTGKSSLLNRILAHAQSLGYCTVHLDFREADQRIFVSLDRFLRWFCINISRRLQLKPDLDSYWDEEMGSKVSCKIYFSAYLLEQIHSPIVLVLNEVNQLFEHPEITQDFLPMLRFWHEQAKQDQTWQKLRLVLAHTTDVYVPLNLNQSPFNVGLAVKLPPFTTDQVQELAQRYELGWSSEAAHTQSALLQNLVGGHPCLVNLALYHLHQGQFTMDQLLKSAATPTGIYGPHLRQLLSVLQENTELLAALRQVVMADKAVQLEVIAAHKLESMGLLRLVGKLAQPSCELYRTYFREQLSNPNQLSRTILLDQKPFNQTSNIAITLDRNSLNRNSLNRSNFEQDRSLQWADHRSLHHSLESLWQKAIHAGSLLSLVRCEVDYFQYFVEAYGAEAGENCLSKIAKIIQDCTEQQHALITRYGNAEFAIVVSMANQQMVADIAEQIRAKVQALGIAHDRSRISGFPAQVITVSLGIASAIPTVQTTPESLFTTAERALYQAKRQGRNQVAIQANGL